MLGGPENGRHLERSVILCKALLWSKDKPFLHDFLMCEVDSESRLSCLWNCNRHVLFFFFFLNRQNVSLIWDLCHFYWWKNCCLICKYPNEKTNIFVPGWVLGREEKHRRGVFLLVVYQSLNWRGNRWAIFPLECYKQICLGPLKTISWEQNVHQVKHFQIE